MPHKKQRRKAARRAKKLAERAWAAVDGGDVQAGRVLIERALTEHQANAGLWKDLAAILELAGDHRGMEEALRRAILIGPNDVESYVELASRLSADGRSRQAAELLETALEREPRSVELRHQLAALAQASAASRPESEPQTELPEDGLMGAEGRRVFALDRYDWGKVRDSLTDEGLAVLPRLLEPERCRALIALFEEPACFEKTVRLDRAQGESGTYKFFRLPLPLELERLRAGVYDVVSPVVNQWSAYLQRSDTWPRSHERFLAECRRRGQRRSTPILLRYRAPARNDLHQDVWGACYFPVQLTVTLSPRTGTSGFTGGEFVLQDLGAGRKLRRREVATSEGDGVLFCTRERLVRIGGRHGLQAVAHGMAPLTSGERYALGLPFHNYKGD